FYGLIALGFSMTFGQLQPISASEISISTSFLITLSIPALIFLAYWWYRLSLVFSHFAHDAQIWRRNFGLILLGSLLIMAVPTSGWFMMEWRTMEVRKELSLLEDTKTFERGLFLFESVLPTQLYSTFWEGQINERSWLYNYDQEDALKDFVQMDRKILAQDFLAMAHRYLPASYPISAEDLETAYIRKQFPAQFDQDALWQWRQELMKRLNYWEELGMLNPFNLHSEHELPSVEGMDWKAIYPGILLFLIPFVGLGFALIYLGFRPFIGYILSITALATVVGTLGQFMTYRVEIQEFFYGMLALAGFFSLYFGFGKAAAKPWIRIAQSVALFVGLTALYGLLIFGPSVLFGFNSQGPPSLLMMTGIMSLMITLWLGPFQQRINYLQTAPSTF
ncbi:MAG: hypothetical protein AAFN10_03545, partial [Bacteroidota bacterium]